MTSSKTNYIKFTFVCVFNEKKTCNLHIIVYMDLPAGIEQKKGQKSGQTRGISRNTNV